MLPLCGDFPGLTGRTPGRAPFIPSKSQRRAPATHPWVTGVFAIGGAHAVGTVVSCWSRSRLSSRKLCGRLVRYSSSRSEHCRGGAARAGAPANCRGCAMSSGVGSIAGGPLAPSYAGCVGRTRPCTTRQWRVSASVPVWRERNRARCSGYHAATRVQLACKYTVSRRQRFMVRQLRKRGDNALSCRG